jgi:hypothetical protein
MLEKSTDIINQDIHNDTAIVELNLRAMCMSPGGLLRSASTILPVGCFAG